MTETPHKNKPVIIFIKLDNHCSTYSHPSKSQGQSTRLKRTNVNPLFKTLLLISIENFFFLQKADFKSEYLIFLYFVIMNCYC